MNGSEIDSIEQRELLGTGTSGAVFRAVSSDGEAIAVKMLNGMAINRNLQQEMQIRLSQSGWPSQVMQVIFADYERVPAMRATPCYADQDSGGNWIPRNVENQGEKKAGITGWKFVEELAAAVAAMHERQVAHGNLKPSNVFFTEDNRLVLADWALGNMPDIVHLQFTDAYLYQSPEQLRMPSGYWREAGYRWDLFSLAVLGYRHLTGLFPRAHEQFLQALAGSSDMSEPGVNVSTTELADALERQEKVYWPTEARDDLELARRGLIEQCLSLNPFQRPANAIEFFRQYQGLEEKFRAQEQIRKANQNRSYAIRSARIAKLVAAVLFLVSALLATWKQLEKRSLTAELGRQIQSAKEMKGKMEAARQKEEQAIQDKDLALEELKMGEATWMARLAASRDMGDRLFAWSIESENGMLPPLDGRKVRLKRLADYYKHFLDRTEGVQAVQKERAISRLHIAEILLSEGKAGEASQQFEKALEGIDELRGGAELDLRLVRDRLLLAILFKENGNENAENEFRRVREELEKIPHSEVDIDQLDYLRAAMNLHESELLAEEGREGEAQEHLLEATKELNRLALERPDSAVLKSELASCYLSSASILDGMGELGEARSLRKMAADNLLELIKKDPTNLQFREELATCYGAIAESSLLAGDIDGAKANSEASISIAENLMRKHPGSIRLRSLLAAQEGIMANLLRDQGEAEKALERYEKGLRMLEGITENSPGIVKFRHAMLLWEKGRMVGFTGDHKQEIELEEHALSLLSKLLESRYGISRAESLTRTMGYLLGDMAHAKELVKDTKGAEISFKESIKLWEKLHKQRPKSEEYEETLAWNRERLQALQEKMSD